MPIRIPAATRMTSFGSLTCQSSWSLKYFVFQEERYSVFIGYAGAMSVKAKPECTDECRNKFCPADYFAEYYCCFVKRSVFHSGFVKRTKTQIIYTETFDTKL